MNSQMFRQRQIQCHQHSRPNNGMEPHDVLCNHVYICRPEFVEVVVCFVPVAQCRNIVGQGINPNINNVIGVKGNRNAPFKRGSGNAQIFQSRFNEVVHQFSGSCLWLQVIGFSQQLFNAVCKRRELEEVRLFLGFHNGAAAFRALAVDQLGLSPEAFTRRTVLSGIFPFIDVSLVVQCFENFLYGFYMVVIGGTDVS